MVEIKTETILSLIMHTVGNAVSGQGPVAGCCECGDEPSGSCATELVS
jgi:hypothetical protein